MTEVDTTDLVEMTVEVLAADEVEDTDAEVDDEL